MNKQPCNIIGETATRSSAVSSNRKSLAGAAAAVIIAVTAASIAKAEQPNTTSPTSSTSNVNVVNTPTVNVGNTPTVNLAGTPNVNIAGSSALLPVQDVTSTAARNANLDTNSTALGLTSIAVGASGALTGLGGAAYSVPAGQTLVITEMEISPASPGSGVNHVVLVSFPNAGGVGVPVLLRDYKVSNGTSSQFSYHTGIAVSGGSTGVHFLVANGLPLSSADNTPSAGPVYVFVNGYITTN